jgi:hypothetical protein
MDRVQYMDIEFGNAGSLDTQGTGWFIGFSEWTKPIGMGAASLRFMPADSLSHTLHVKWMVHAANDGRGAAKPPSEGRTLSILVSEAGVFRLQFSRYKDFPEQHVLEYTLRQHGDFVIWGEGIHHRWFVDEQSTVMTLRWVPVPAVQESAETPPGTKL